ncbi:MAG: hypothetical protein H6642_04000 [Caldilineaceae bacterium]|nr:hypothetical protein [Caldilineaceae bacterium]
MAELAPDTAVQGIEANYYNITNGEGMPIAGLMVMVDRLNRPVQAELHLHDDISEDRAVLEAAREVAISRGRQLLQARYYSRSSVPMRVLHTYPERAPVTVRLPEGQSQRSREAAAEEGFNWMMILGALAALLILGLLIWGIVRALGNRGDTVQESAPALTVTQAADAAAESSDTPASEPTLPPSRNARSDIQIGSRVQIVPGYQLTLRSEPGPEAGQEVGYMADNQRATVIGGPVMTQGNSDTIVWWQIQLDEGGEAWAAANTSDVTLLMPAAE